MYRYYVLIFAVLLGTCCLLHAEGEREPQLIWRPEKPLHVIVPAPAGGPIDRVIRIVADELEDYLGQKVVVVYRPGELGAEGTLECLNSAHDGYTWASGKATHLGIYRLLGLSDTTWDDWILFLIMGDVSVVSVGSDTPYNDFGQLLDALESDPEKISVATPGRFSVGHNAMESIRGYAGIRYEHITFDGGSMAVAAVAEGDAEVVAQPAVEQAESLRQNMVRALAVLDYEPLELSGYGTIPSITQWIPEFVPTPSFFGMWIPRDAPGDVIETFGNFWNTIVRDSVVLRAFASERGAVMDPVWGVEAVNRALPHLETTAWNLQTKGETKVSPGEIGIKKP
jgi:tripartite-type tricarboxylate transporter receptor subunit TctC